MKALGTRFGMIGAALLMGALALCGCPAQAQLGGMGGTPIIDWTVSTYAEGTNISGTNPINLKLDIDWTNSQNTTGLWYFEEAISASPHSFIYNDPNNSHSVPDGHGGWVLSSLYEYSYSGSAHSEGNINYVNVWAASGQARVALNTTIASMFGNPTLPSGSVITEYAVDCSFAARLYNGLNQLLEDKTPISTTIYHSY